MNWQGKTISAAGTLTAQMIEDCAQRCMANFGRPEIIPVSQKFIDDLLAWEALEREWKKHPPYIYKQLKLKHFLKGKWAKPREIKVLPLPL